MLLQTTVQVKESRNVGISILLLKVIPFQAVHRLLLCMTSTEACKMVVNYKKFNGKTYSNSDIEILMNRI